MKKISILIRLLLSIFFISMLFFFVQWDEILFRVRDINFLFFSLSFLMVPLMVFLSCLKWKILLSNEKCHLGFGYLMRIYLIGYFFTNLLPSIVGGDLVRSYYLGRRIGSHNNAAVSVLLERFSGLLVLLILGVLSPLLKPELYLLLAILVPSSLAAFIFLAIFFIGKKRFFLPIFNRVASKVLAGLFRFNVVFLGGYANILNERIAILYDRISKILKKFHEKLAYTVYELKVQKNRVVNLIILTILIYLLTFINIYFAFLTFGVYPSLQEVTAVLPIILIIILIPVSHGNLGFSEGVYVFYFSLIGIDPSASLTMAFFLRFKLLCTGFIGLIFFLTCKETKNNLSELIKSKI